MTSLRRSACCLSRRRSCWPSCRRALLRLRRRVSWHGIGAASAVVGTSRAKDAAAFCSAPRSAPSPWSAHAFTAAPVSPLTALFTEHTAPELLYLETRWASLVSFGLTAGLLKDVLPIDARTNAATIRNHLHKVATRQEAELGDERPRFLEGDPADGKELPVPEGPIIVGLDGAYLRSWHDKNRKFEVIVGKSVPEVRDHRYFGLVQTHDDKPEHRLFEVLRAQDLRMNQGLTFLTDGGDSVRSFLDGISPCAETYLDWFHITMRLTVLSQYIRGLAGHNPVEALALQSRLDRIKWRLWHGDTDVALSRARELAAEVAALTSDYPGLPRFAKAAAGLVTSSHFGQL